MIKNDVKKHNLLTITRIKILIHLSVVLKNLYDYFYKNYFYG